MEDAGTSEEDDTDSQDSNIAMDHGYLAWNCSIKIITLAVKALVISEFILLQVLCFEAFFQETAEERQGYSYHIRKVKMLLFMEDGTVQVLEPTVDNSGIPQGTLISRQRIPYPAPRNSDFYDILDFNIGKEVELYGRVYKVTNCDRYTRHFLNRLGIHVPDPIPVPPDPYAEIRAKVNTT